MPDLAEWSAVLEAVSKRPPDECNAEWEWLMEQLGLGPDHFLGIYEALQQGRWRMAKDPRAYIKTVAKRIVEKSELPTTGETALVFPSAIEVEGEELGQEERLEYILNEQKSVDPTKGADGVWRSGPGWNRDYGNERNGHASYRDFLVAKVPDDLRGLQFPDKEELAEIAGFNESTDEFHIYAQTVARPRWAAWAEAAGLDEWERRVLEYRVTGTSRERALAGQPDEASRKELQAAWRRFDRTGVRRLLRVIKKMSRNDAKGTLG
jgi:hypothetical protein